MRICRAIELVLSAEKARSYIYNVDDEPLEADEILLLLTGSRARDPEALSEEEKWKDHGFNQNPGRLRFRASLPSLRHAISKCPL
jgi:hypothetical protein